MIDYSIIIPAYNAASTLPNCLRALRQQSIDRSHYEIIVVDDGSTDRAVNIAQEFTKDDSHLHIIGVPHGGQAAARNAGVKIAQGALILFTDADCEPQPDWIERL